MRRKSNFRLALNVFNQKFKNRTIFCWVGIAYFVSGILIIVAPASMAVCTAFNRKSFSVLVASSGENWTSQTYFSHKSHVFWWMPRLHLASFLIYIPYAQDWLLKRHEFVDIWPLLKLHMLHQYLFLTTR